MSIVNIIVKFLVEKSFSLFFVLFGKPAIPLFMKESIKRYKSNDFSEIFQTIRIWDAPYEQLFKYIPTRGVVIDLGCGDGLLANSIALAHKRTSVYGIDINKDRINNANKNVNNAFFVSGDILSKKIPQADTIILSHVFHHLLSFKDQEKLLKKCIGKLKPGGSILVVEIDNTPIFKYLLTYFVDVFIVPMLFENRLWNFKIYYRTEAMWRALFKNNNLKVKATKASQGKPFTHIIFVCSK